MRMNRTPALIMIAVAAVLVASVVVGRMLITDSPSSSSQAETQGLPPIPEKYVEYMNGLGKTFVVDNEITERDREAGAKAVEAAIKSFGFIQPEQAKYASFGTMTVAGEKESEGGRPVWAVYFFSVVMPASGGDPEEKPVPNDFWVMVDPETHEMAYAATVPGVVSEG